jgi:Flp pilus assembly protein TadD
MSDEVERAALLLEAGRVSAARELIGRRLREAPDDLTALGLAAWAAELEDDHAEALRLVARPLAADPDDVHLLAVLAWALAGSGDWRAARNAAARRIDLAPGDWTVLADLAGIDLRADHHDEGTLRAAREAVRLAPHEPAARIRLGAVHLARNEDGAARREFREALRLDPVSVEARHDLAVTEMRRGGVVSAAREFARLSTQGEVAKPAVHNLAIAGQRALWVVQLVVLGTAMTATVWTESERAETVVPRLVTHLLAAGIAVAVAGGAAAYTVRRLGRSWSGIAALLRRTAPLLAVWAGAIAVAVLLILVPLADSGGGLDHLYGYAALVALGGFVIGAFSAASLRRRRP